MDPEKHVEWNGHQGPFLGESEAGYKLIRCSRCEFSHVVPIPDNAKLEKIYREEYYSEEKPDYIAEALQDEDWWRCVHGDRLHLFRKHLAPSRNRLLDIGSGPGFFLKHAQQTGWKVRGIEPNHNAWEFSTNELGLLVENAFFDQAIAPKLGLFDAIHLSEVIEHLPDPLSFLRVAVDNLNPGGLLCLVAPNEHNPLQQILHDSFDIDKWWLAPPHHINYFDHKSLIHLLERLELSVVEITSTFPMEFFLLMGENYIGNANLGRECHRMRKSFETAFGRAERFDLKRDLFRKFAELGIGREAVVIAKKP